MADKIKVPQLKPDGTMEEKIGTLIEVKGVNEPWTEYILENDTKIRIKNSLVNIVELDNEKTPNREPVYVIQAQQITNIIPKL